MNKPRRTKRQQPALCPSQAPTPAAPLQIAPVEIDRIPQNAEEIAAWAKGMGRGVQIPSLHLFQREM